MLTEKNKMIMDREIRHQGAITDVENSKCRIIDSMYDLKLSLYRNELTASDYESIRDFIREILNPLMLELDEGAIDKIFDLQKQNEMS